ncbi:MAG: 6-carboxytetrahydropterin synthase [Eubacterium sp.]|nr:6-carboxytetrahydropterin synthase [Eubacterium sp.]
MLRYYVYKYYFNASHSADGGKEKMHSHTFQIALYIKQDEEKEYLFGEIDKDIKNYLSRFDGVFLPEIPEFAGTTASLEDIGEKLYDDIFKLLEDKGLWLYQLEIMDNPLRVYMVSNKIMSQSKSEEKHMQSIEWLLERKEMMK